jgi:predicted DNA-binding protein (MmcQ/YjbR family)
MAHVVTPPTPNIARIADELAGHALGYPGTSEEHPWGHRAFKVNKKTFLFLYADATGLSLSTKLPNSGQLALELPFAEPTGYGLGKSGWVSAKFAPSARIPVGLLREWIDESFRAIAPRKVVAGLIGPPETKPRAKATQPKLAKNAAQDPQSHARARPTKPRKRALSTKPR